MNSDEIDDFFLGAGDELMNSEKCLHCGQVFYLDQKLEWIDEAKNICKCPNCGKEVEIL
jgi:DNA-directed RNA polymerase subunit RPC12/RpoP